MDQEDLITEDEMDEVPYVEYDISTSPADPTLELLVQQLSREDIIVPFYQRKYVWKIEQASRLIESFLMGLPVPQIFLYVNKEDQLEIIDGQQRVMSVKYFFDGYFGEEDNKGNKQVFKLKGLSERSEYNGKKFSELTTRDQRKLKNSTLRAIHIKQTRPKEDNESAFHIFERLNTGGTRLKPQEIRNAVYRGNIVNELKNLNSHKTWQSILGLNKPDKSQKDVELILRLFSLFETWPQYEKPMLSFLNKNMSENRDFSSEKASAFKSKFKEACDFVNLTLTKPFRPKNVLNQAVLEAVMISLMEHPNMQQINLDNNYPILLGDKEFLENITGPTTDTLVLQKRISRAKSILTNAAS